jgi:SAM-dependent methyltransferase
MGWDESAQAWISALGDEGDFGRRFVLDGPMMERLRDRGFERALDVGCGEGRFCRMMQSLQISTVGVDPTQALIEEARRRDPAGDYRLGTAEALDVPAGSFDVAVCYLTLIDIDDLLGAIAQIDRALKPGGTLLIANLTSFNTAGSSAGWEPDAAGVMRFTIDDYLTPRRTLVEWRGIRVHNWHRPLSDYLSPLIDRGFSLTYFAEPKPSGGTPEQVARYCRVPWFYIAEWKKP